MFPLNQRLCAYNPLLLLNTEYYILIFNNYDLKILVVLLFVLGSICQMSIYMNKLEKND